MKKWALKHAMKQAEIFLERCKDLEENHTVNLLFKNDSDVNHGKYSASVKRSSMDLTRALAELRKS